MTNCQLLLHMPRPKKVLLDLQRQSGIVQSSELKQVSTRTPALIPNTAGSMSR